MATVEVLEKVPMNVVEVKQALEKIKKETPELNFRAAKTDEYAQELAKLKPAQAKDLFKKLMDLNVPRFKEQHAHKLIDLMPQTDKQVKLILTAYHMTIKGEDVKRLTKTVGEFL